MTHSATLLSLVVALMLPASAALAEDHIPGPDESSSPSQMLSASGSPFERAVKQRRSRTTFKAVRGDSVEDARYLGRSIPLDIASVARVEGDGLSLDVALWDAPAELAPESMVVYFAKPGAMAPQWAAYQPAPQAEGQPTEWALFRYDPGTGLFDARVADARVERQGERIELRADRDDAMPRTVVAFVETRSGDDEDWAWKDQAPTRRTGLKLR